MEKTQETIGRSLVKTLSWRITVLILDFLIAYVLTKDVDLSSKLAIAKLVIASIFYFAHERFWNKISWDKV